MLSAWHIRGATLAPEVLACCCLVADVALEDRLRALPAPELWALAA